MGKTIKNKIQNLNKIPHPKSRKTAQLSKKIIRASGKEKTKLKHFMKLNLIGERLLWFRDHLELSDVYTPELTAKLIKGYLSRFDNELEQINIKHSTGKRKGRQHANREDVIKMTIKNEKNEFETCGIEIADILDQQQLNLLRNWSGELRFLHNFKLVRYSKIKLEKLSKSKVPSTNVNKKKLVQNQNFQPDKCKANLNQKEVIEKINKKECEVNGEEDQKIKEKNLEGMEVDQVIK